MTAARARELEMEHELAISNFSVDEPTFVEHSPAQVDRVDAAQCSSITNVERASAGETIIDRTRLLQRVAVCHEILDCSIQLLPFLLLRSIRSAD